MVVIPVIIIVIIILLAIGFVAAASRDMAHAGEAEYQSKAGLGYTLLMVLALFIVAGLLGVGPLAGIVVLAK